MKYLIDSNSLITPARLYYSFDFACSFWEQLKDNIENEKIIILDSVYNEINKSDDELSSWIKSINKDLILKKNDEIVLKYSEIINYINTCGLYKSSAFSDWARFDVADPWLIAAAVVNQYEIVTFEVHDFNLNEKTPSKKIKIPNICDVFGVKYIKLFEMMRNLEIQL